MKTFTARILLSCLAVVLIASAASANTATQWGDFTIKDPSEVIPVNAWAFDDNVNPPGFPPRFPSQSAQYPVTPLLQLLIRDISALR